MAGLMVVFLTELTAVHISRNTDDSDKDDLLRLSKCCYVLSAVTIRCVQIRLQC